MSLQALPDFQQLLRTESFMLYYPYEGVGPCHVLPNQLTITTTAAGQLDFQLAFVRGQLPNRPPQPHGRLAFGMQPQADLAAALDLVRQVRPAATVAPMHLGRGTLRLVAVNAIAELPAELLVAQPLQWVGAEPLQVQFTLSPTAATFVRDALQGELLPLAAYVELQFQGVAPRLPVQVTLAPHLVLSALLAVADSERRLPRLAIVRYFLRYFDQQLPPLPFTITGTLADGDQADFAETLADRLIARFGHFVPTPAPTQGDYVQLAAWDETVTAEFHWDLQEPILATRQIGLRLDPFAAAQQLVQAQGLAALYTERIVPALPTGIHQLYISTNFPPQIQGVVTTGVRIRVPPAPPMRNYEIVQELEGLAEHDEQTMLLRLAFREPLAYWYSTFLIINGPAGSETVWGEERLHTAITLRLTTSDYGVQLATLTAVPQLLALAALGGSYRWQTAAGQQESHFTFGDKTQITLLLPRGATDARISLQAISHQTATTLTLDDLPFQSTQLGLYSFPEYGSHTLAITCHFPTPLAGTDHASVELQPQTLTDPPAAPTTLHFTPEQPHKQWHWFAASPFAGGYRYRVQHNQATAPTAWSDLQSPFVPLTIEIGATAMEGYVPGDQRFGELIYYPDPNDAERFFYLPGVPLPVLDPQGRPMLSLLIAGASGFLQLDVRWQATTATLDALRQEILAQQPTLVPALLRLSFAPVTVEQIALILRQENEAHEQVLATAQSAGVPPYNGLFSVALNAEQQDLVIAALHDRAGILLVRYTGTRAIAVAATVTIVGDIQQAFTELTATATLAACQQWVTVALAAKRLQQMRNGSPVVPPPLWQRTEAEAIDLAAQWLHRHLQRTPTPSQTKRPAQRAAAEATNLEVTTTLTETLAIQLVRTADISTWFRDGTGDDHIRIVG